MLYEFVGAFIAFFRRGLVSEIFVGGVVCNSSIVSCCCLIGAGAGAGAGAGGGSEAGDEAVDGGGGNEEEDAPTAS